MKTRPPPTPQEADRSDLYPRRPEGGTGRLHPPRRSGEGPSSCLRRRALRSPLDAPVRTLPAAPTMRPRISDKSSWRREGAIRVMIPRTGSRQTRLKWRFQSMAASSTMVPTSARRTWMVDPSGPHPPAALHGEDDAERAREKAGSVEDDLPAAGRVHGPHDEPVRGVGDRARDHQQQGQSVMVRLHVSPVRKMRST